MNQEDLNTKSSRKTNLGLIIGIVIAIVVIVAVVIVVSLLILDNQKNYIDDNNGNSNVINQDFNGNVKLIKKYNNPITNYVTSENTNLTHFSIEDNNQTQIIDVNSNVILDKGGYSASYLGDDYYLTANNSEQKASVIKDNQVVFEFNFPKGLSYGISAYKNNLLYYVTSMNNEKYVVAYNLLTKKELWKVKGESPVILENNNIIVESYSNSHDTIVDENGNIIAAADENTKVYPTATKYYFKIINNNLEIYDDKEKISELSLMTKDKIFYNFVSPLSNGMFVIKEYNSNDFKNTYKVYDKDLNLIIQLDDCNELEGSVLGYSTLVTTSSTVNDSDKSIITDAIKDGNEIFDVIIYSDGSIEKVYSLETKDGLLDSLSAKSFNKKHYAIGLDIKGIKLINLDNKNTKTISDGSWTTSIDESSNGKYVIINYNDSKTKYVLNENLENIYETDNKLKVVNDKFVIEYSLKNKEEIYLVNVFTKEKKLLNTDGSYYDNNSVGLITYDNGTYNLYSLN